MGETLSNTEVAHELSLRHHKSQSEKNEERVEILEAILLAVVAVSTAWSGYQTARWDGRQAHLYGLSNKERAAQNREATKSGQQRIYDTTTFGFWLQETATGHHQAALFVRRFRPEYRVAFDAWIKTGFFHNLKAPPGPILMPQYHNAAGERAAAYDRQTSATFEEGTEARETGDHYLRNTVLLATVLFLTALSQRFKVRPRRADCGVRLPAWRSPFTTYSPTRSPETVHPRGMIAARQRCLAWSPWPTHLACWCWAAASPASAPHRS